MNKIIRIFIVIILIPILVFVIGSANILFHQNKGESISHGTRFNGTLENGWLLPYTNDNFSSFSFTSYYLMKNAFIHHKVYQSILDSYKKLEEIKPNIYYRYMECSDIEGGSVYLHRSHRNGTSIDFMVPKIREGQVYTDIDDWGLAHYFLEFDSEGQLEPIYPFTNFIHPIIGKIISTQLDSKVRIDFETMAQHILAIDDACNKNGISISKVIFKIELKDELFATKSGIILKSRGVPFASKLKNSVNEMHDEHYHIDFKL